MRRLLCTILLVLFATNAQAIPHTILQHDLEVTLEPATARLSVTDRIRFGAHQGSTDPLDFMLNENLEITAVRFRWTELEVETLPRWRPRDFYDEPDYSELGMFGVARQHRINAPEGGWPDTLFDVEIEYSGAVYDSLRPPEVAYGRGFETTTGLIDERGAYLSLETFWIPWTTEERFQFRMKTDLPDGWHSVSQGRRAEHSSADGRNLTVWETESPQELAYLVAGPYTIREQDHDGVQLYTYTYADTPENLCNTYLHAAGRYLDRYGELIAPYGFSKWAMVENWWQTGYGMPGFTLLGNRVIRLPFIVDTSYGHEILHCWWGNGVYVDYESGNWCEGLTAYQADYAYKLEESDAAARDYRRNALTGYLDFASGAGEDFPLREFRERSDFGTQAIGYGKCLMVFHMLEDELGTEVFERVLQEFYARFEFKSASWDDLAYVFSDMTGRDLRDWFEAWVGRTGSARISIAGLDRSAEGWTLHVEQDGDPFPIVLPVQWTDAEGEHETRLGLRAGTATLQLPASLRSVAVDPDYHIFREVFREEIPAALSQILGADSTLVVIGSDCDAPTRDALHAVATEWSQNQDMIIVDEGDLVDGLGAGRGIFVLGPGALAQSMFAEATATLGDAPGAVRAENEGKSLIAVFRDPADPELARAVILPESPEMVPALGRKIPHYSRYSWLVFDGEQNVGKGNWTVLTSPLRRTVGDSE